jgi:CRISPR-associated protein Csx17
MGIMSELELCGCTPEPLMGYLKALGVFRLVADQFDPSCAMFWRGGVCWLQTTLDRDSLVEFFLTEYRPTPVVTPWNSASGFAPTKAENKAPKDKAARAALAAIEQSTIPRLDPYRETIAAIQKLPRGNEDDKNWKQGFFLRCRAELPDAVVAWLDTCFCLSNESLSSFPLLGSGGNDGVTEFGSLFMQRVVDILLPAKSASPGTPSQEFLRTALFSGREGDGKPSTARPPSLMQDTVGQFHPGGTGGANATQGGFEAKSLVNPWDFVLMIEGALLFAGSVARRLEANSTQKAVFPFTVDSVAVGYGSATASEETTDGSRAELWMPLWDRPASLAEVTHLFAEGRAQLGRRQARNAVEFALSVSLLGFDRGVTAFARYGFLKRNGLNFLATPLGRVQVTPKPSAQLLNDPKLAVWLDGCRSGCRDKEKTPARYQTALRQTNRAMYGFAVGSESGGSAQQGALLDVLRALGRAEQTLSRATKFCEDNHIRPLRDLNPQWLDQANDGSPEFGLAQAVAGIRGSGEVGPFRVFLESVETAGSSFNWRKDKAGSAVWSNRTLSANLATVFRRRQMEAFRDGQSGTPLSSPRPARLSDVSAFLYGATDDDMLADLLWALAAIDWSKIGDYRVPESFDDEVPSEFGALRLLVEPGTFAAVGGFWELKTSDTPNAKPDPDVFHILASGQSNAVEQNVDHAALRLKSGGLLVKGYRNRGRSGKPLGLRSLIPAHRLLASMLFPLSDRDLRTVANLVLYPPENKE